MLITLLAVFALVSRLIPHAPNLAALGALAFVAGREWPRRGPWFAVAVAILSDLIVGLYSLPVMLTVWGSYLLVGYLGRSSRRWSLQSLGWAPILKTVGTVSLGSVAFFVLTNLAVWAGGNWYPHTLAALVSCYVNALPFFRNSFVSDISFTTVMLAALEGRVVLSSWVNRRSPSSRLSTKKAS